MPIAPHQFVELYPHVYHMAEEGTWESIDAQGLLSTSALLDLYEIYGNDRLPIESQHRPESAIINHPVYGRAVIRDQKPMRESSLRKCLTKMAPREWYELLNSKVFFWINWERLLGLLSARLYRDRVHCILTVDSERLIARHLNRIRLSPINSGSTIYQPQPRGRETFLPLDQYPYEVRKKKRGQANAIAELCVDYSVPDISELVIRVAHLDGGRETQVLYQR